MKQQRAETTADGHFIVMCRVSGGVTGTHEAQLKRDGEPRIFATREEAEQAASDARSFGRTGFGSAQFHYWVEEVTR